MKGSTDRPEAWPFPDGLVLTDMMDPRGTSCHQVSADQGWFQLQCCQEKLIVATPALSFAIGRFLFLFLACRDTHVHKEREKERQRDSSRAAL